MDLVSCIIEYLTLDDILPFRATSKQIWFDSTRLQLLFIPKQYLMNLQHTMKLFPHTRYLNINSISELQTLKQNSSNYSPEKSNSNRISTLRYFLNSISHLDIYSLHIDHIDDLKDKNEIFHQISYPTFQHLTILHIYKANCSTIILDKLFRSARNIKTLLLHNIYLLNDFALNRIIYHSHQIESIDVSKSIMIHSISIPPTTASKLLSLSITKCHYFQYIVVSVICSKLVKCNLSNTNISNTNLTNFLLHTPVLEYLNLSCCPLIYSLNINSTSLQYLSVRFCINLVNVEVLAHKLNHVDVLQCSSLTHLLINSNVLGKLDATMLTSLNYVILKCPHLKSIDISGCIQLNNLRISDHDHFITLQNDETLKAFAENIITQKHFEVLSEFASACPTIVVNGWTQGEPMYTTSDGFQVAKHGAERRSSSI